VQRRPSVNEVIYPVHSALFTQIARTEGAFSRVIDNLPIFVDLTARGDHGHFIVSIRLVCCQSLNSKLQTV
jgi:hypothetical protein